MVTILKAQFRDTKSIYTMQASPRSITPRLIKPNPVPIKHQGHNSLTVFLPLHSILSFYEFYDTGHLSKVASSHICLLVTGLFYLA